MKSQGYGMLMASTQVDEDAQHFYRKLGYKDCGGFVVDVPGYEQPKEMILVGMIAVFDIQNSRMGDIAYRVNPVYWSMGITTEALKEVVRFIFENTEINRLNGRVDVRNVASNKVMEKCGFIKEGTVRQGKMVSVYCDYNIYGMLREDYMSMKGINS